RDRSSVGAPRSLNALHGGRLAGAIRPDQPEDLSLVDVEGHVGDGDRSAIALRERAHADDGRRHRTDVTRALAVVSRTLGQDRSAMRGPSRRSAALLAQVDVGKPRAAEARTGDIMA